MQSPTKYFLIEIEMMPYSFLREALALVHYIHD